MDPVIVPALALVATKIGLAMLKGEQGGFSLGAGANSLLDIVADVGKDKIWACAEKRLLQRLRSPGEALHNHHLTTAVGESIKLVILKAAEEPALVDFKSELKKVAAAASGMWTALAEAKKPELAQLSDARLTELVAVPASSRSTLTVLDVPTWETFLHASGGSKDSPIHLPAEVVTNVADRLHRTLPQALVEVLKHDAEHGGAAFAGLQLLIFGELLAVCLDIRSSQQAQQEFIKSTAADAATRHAELVEKLDRLAKQVAIQSEEVFARLSETNRREFRKEGIRQDEILQSFWQLKMSIYLPFRPVEDRENFGDEKIPDSFRPSRSEYREGLVHRPTLASGVEQSLARGGFALVRGEGASGKTVLALAIALDERFRDHTAYYLDLTDRDEDDAEAIEKLRTLAADRVLFIVDNVHLNERAALDVFEAWKANPQGSRLLMLGRHVETGPDLEGLQPLLGGIGPAEVFSLQVETRDLVGAFNRLARRTGTHVVVPTPPPEAQVAWLKLFQGSLVFFSAAIKNKLAELMRGHWPLTRDDARVYVRRKYLEGEEISEQERNCLLRVAVFARLELSASEEMLGWPQLDHSLKHGLVYRSVHGGQFTRYRLSHPGLGDLLLSASGDLLEERQVCIEAAQRSPFAGTYLAGRLLLLGRTEAAQEVLRAAVRQSNALESFTESGLQHLHALCRWAERLGILSEARQLGQWDQQVALLAAQAGRTPLQNLASFLCYARETPELKGLFAAVAKQLDAGKLAARAEAKETSLANLASFLRYARGTPELKGLFATVAKQLDAGKLTAIAEAKETSLADLASFLRYARETPELKGLFATVAKRLDAKKLAMQADRSPLHFLANFLSYARETPELKGLFATVAKQLDAEKLAAIAEAKETSLTDLASFLRYARETPELKALFAAVVKQLDAGKLAVQADRSPLDFLASFLTYARETPELKGLFAEVVKRMDAVQLAAHAEHTPLDSLASFLRYAEKTGELKVVFAAVMAKLAQPDAITALARNACTEPLPHLLSFLRTSSLGSAVVGAIPLTTWVAARSVARDEQPGYLAELFKVLNKFGRPELAEAPAAALLRVPDPALWHSSPVGLHHLTHALRLGRAVGREVIAKFLEAVVTPEWLRAQYEYSTAYPGATAGALFAVWGLDEPAFLEHFLRELPRDLVSQSLARFYSADAEEAGGILSLLGFAELADLPVNATGVRWPPAVPVTVSDTLTSISAPVVLSWLGLRAMARYRPDQLKLPPATGNRVLTLWRNSQSPTPRHAALNCWMIAWLERCASAGWVLLPDNSRLQLETPVAG